MATYTKYPLSGSTNGKQIKVAATSSPGTTIHTAVSGTSDLDEIWLYAVNTDTANRELIIQWGGTTSPDDDIALTLAPREGKVLVVSGELLQNSLVVKAYCATANVIVISGFVNRIT